MTEMDCKTKQCSNETASMKNKRQSSFCEKSEQELSVPQLIDKLANKMCEDLSDLTKTKKREIISELKSTAFSILLKKTSHAIEDVDELEKDMLIATLVDHLLWNEMKGNLSWNKHNKKRIFNIIDKLSDSITERPALLNVVKFLLLMSGFKSSQTNAKEDQFLSSDNCLPFKQYSQMSKRVQNAYDSTDHISLLENFVPSIVDKSLLIDSSTNLNTNRIPNISDFPFDSMPGTGLTLIEKYSTFWSDTSKTPSSLIDPVGGNGLISLNIPEFNAELPRSLTIPSLRSSHLDEGYATPEKDLVNDSDRLSGSTEDVNANEIWKTVTNEMLFQPLRYAWESLGKEERLKEIPFLEESSVDTVERWKHHVQLLNFYNSDELDSSVDDVLSHSIADNKQTFNDPSTISLQEYFRDLKYLLIGIDSQLFYYVEEMETFVIKDNISVPGICSETLASYSTGFISCGNNFRTLSQLMAKSHKRNESLESNRDMVSSTEVAQLSASDSSTNTGNGDPLMSTNERFSACREGVVFEAMCSSINNFLQLYRGMIIRLVKPNSNTLLDLKCLLQPLQQQLEFLVQLCCPAVPNFTLPLGGALLSHIYNMVQITVSSPFSYILYHILERCSYVYFRFMEKWMFEGICDDPYGEFFIEMKNSDETTLDRSYWKKTFILREEKVPIFLSGIANDIFVCGKTLNLIKFCNQNDTFSRQLENSYPRMIPCLDENGLNQLAEEFHRFVTSCTNESDAAIASVLAPSCDTEEEKELRCQAVVQQREKSITRIKDAQIERKKKTEEGKRKIFESMKKEMMDAESRKKEERHKEIEEDQKRLEGYAKSALIEAAKRDEEKRRMIQFYKALSDAAEQRRMKAEWKIKRLRLNNRRVEFLSKDKKKLLEELLQCKSEGLLLNRTISNELLMGGYHGSSSTTWLSWPSKPSSLDYFSANNSTVKTDLSSELASRGILNKSSLLFKRNSFPNLYLSNDLYDLKLRLDCCKCSSDSDLYSKTLENFRSIKRQELKDLKTLSGYFKVESTKLEIIDKDNNNYFDRSKTLVSIQVSSHEFNKTEDPNGNEESEQSVPCIVDTENETPRDDRSKENDCIVESNFDTNKDQDLITEKENLNKSFSDTRNAAKLNKLRVYEDEYGIKLAVNTDGSSPVDDEKKIDYSSCKERVLEKKTRTLENLIKERTEELQSAIFNVMESRKEAARNKAKAMSDIYSSMRNNKDKTGVKMDNTKPMKIESSEDKMESGNQPIIAESVSCDNSNNNITMEKSEPEVKNNVNTLEPCITVINTDYIDSNGNFTLSNRPLITDIADRCVRIKPELRIIESANVTKIHDCLYKSVSIPTEVQKTFTNSAILRLFIINEKLIDHLQCIRKHFFLLDGEYGRSLVKHLFVALQTVERPSCLLTHMQLNMILRSAGRLPSEEPLIERLSFFVKETPLAFVLTDPDVLTCLSMRYATYWPLNIILTREAIHNYDNIFAFQLKVQHAVWVLEQDMQLLKIPNMMKSTHYRQLQIFRHTMTQFVQALCNYVTQIAFEDSWLEFKKVLKKVNSLDSLYMAHVDYIKMILFRCLLNKRSEKIQKTIMELLRTILSFHELLRHGEWTYDKVNGGHTHSAFSRLLHQYTAFTRLMKYLLQCLQQYVIWGQPHLNLLITFLSGNDFFMR